MDVRFEGMDGHGRPVFVPADPAAVSEWRDSMLRATYLRGAVLQPFERWLRSCYASLEQHNFRPDTPAADEPTIVEAK